VVWQPDQVNHLMPAELVRGADLLVDQWPAMAFEGVVQGFVYALLALACTRAAGRVDVGQVAGFSLGLFAAYLVFWLLGFRPGPTPDVAPLPVLGFLALALVAAVAVATAVSVAVDVRWSAPLGVGVFAVVQLGIWLLRGPLAEPQVRLFRPHELLPGADDVQLAVVLLAAAAIAGSLVAARRGVPPVVVSGALSGLAALLYLVKVPGAAWYLTGIAVGLYAVTAAVLGLGTRGVVVAAVLLGLVQVLVETVVGPRWWLPFAGFLLVAAIGFRVLLARRRPRVQVAG
jgi:branched-chain amino acid transport system permease protein